MLLAATMSTSLRTLSFRLAACCRCRARHEERAVARRAGCRQRCSLNVRRAARTYLSVVLRAGPPTRSRVKHPRGYLAYGRYEDTHEP
eukprot:2356518-Prymnesium_polylepis.1